METRLSAPFATANRCLGVFSLSTGLIALGAFDVYCGVAALLNHVPGAVKYPQFEHPQLQNEYYQECMGGGGNKEAEGCTTAAASKIFYSVLFSWAQDWYFVALGTAAVAFGSVAIKAAEMHRDGGTGLARRYYIWCCVRAALVSAWGLINFHARAFCWTFCLNLYFVWVSRNFLSSLREPREDRGAGVLQAARLESEATASPGMGTARPKSCCGALSLPTAVIICGGSDVLRGGSAALNSVAALVTSLLSFDRSGLESMMYIRCISDGVDAEKCAPAAANQVVLQFFSVLAFACFMVLLGLCVCGFGVAGVKAAEAPSYKLALRYYVFCCVRVAPAILKDLFNIVDGSGNVWTPFWIFWWIYAVQVTKNYCNYLRRRDEDLANGAAGGYLTISGVEMSGGYTHTY